MGILRNLVIFCIFSISTNVFSAESGAFQKENDYYANCYDDTENSFLFKIRGFYAATYAKMSGLAVPTSYGVLKNEKLAQHGYGFDAAMTIFVTDYIAEEISLGLGFYKIKSLALLDAATTYGAGILNLGKRNQIFIVPVTFATQYHAVLGERLKPYIGIGLNGPHMHTCSRAIKVDNGFESALQVGVDFISKDGTLFILDIRQYLLRSKVKFNKSYLGTDGINLKVVWNPIVVSTGFGFEI